MSTKIHRDVVVVYSPIAVLVSLYWNESQGLKWSERQSKDLYYLSGVVSESVEKAVDVLMRHGSTTFFEQDMIARKWKDFDQDPDLFDLIVDAEEPEQAFISRYILEG